MNKTPKGTHFILENEKPLEQLWDIAKQFGAETEIRDWMNSYVESFWVKNNISHNALERRTKEEKEGLLNYKKRQALTELGTIAAEKAHTWFDKYGDHELTYEYSMLIILPKKKDKEPL